MVKFIGFIVVITGTTLIGFKYANNISQRYKSLLYLKKVLTMLKGEIEYNESEIIQIFGVLQRKTNGDISAFFGELYEKTNNSYEQTISDYWNQAIDNKLMNMAYSKEDIIKIKELGDNLGYLDKKMQLSNIDYTVDYIEKETKELSTNMDKNIKMCRMFGVLSGIFIIILFL